MRTQKKIISETTPLQIICVIAWLWVVPVIDSFDSYTYGMATRALVTSFISFTLGIIVAGNIPQVATLKRGRCALVIGIVILLLFLVFLVPLFQRLGHWYTRNCALFRAAGFLLLGFGLSITEVFRKTPTFKTGVAVLLGLYIIYNLLLWGSHNPHPDRMPLYYLAHMLLALVRISIIVALWKTLSAGSVMEFCNRYRKCSSLFAGLFWGMFLVMPVGSYASGGIAVLMLFLAPIFAYIMTVAVRFSVRLTMYVVKGVLANRFWWLESCRWWLDKEDNSENLEK